LLNIRSGSPNTDSKVTSVPTLSPGVEIESVSFSYRYCTGFGTKGTGANFTMRVAGSAVYSSPQLNDYPYHKSTDPKVYSPAVKVTNNQLKITVPSAGVSDIEFDFHNGAMNMQLLLPITVAITCSGGPCIKPIPTISVIAQDNVTVLMEPTKYRDGAGSVPASLQFPMPADFNDGKLLSWTIRDSPRFVQASDGVVPPGAVGEKIDPLLVNTSGFDLRNAATDVYIFLPGAAAATTASTAATTASNTATAASISASNYGYTGLRREYLTLTGPIPTLPDKAFGTWFSWYHPYNQTGALADIARWKSEDLPLDIWGLDMNWRITAGGMEGKEYKINTALFPNMTAFMESAHEVRQCRQCRQCSQYKVQSKWAPSVDSEDSVVNTR
jgi:hypothetical protein